MVNVMSDCGIDNSRYVPFIATTADFQKPKRSPLENITRVR